MKISLASKKLCAAIKNCVCQEEDSLSSVCYLLHFQQWYYCITSKRKTGIRNSSLQACNPPPPTTTTNIRCLSINDQLQCIFILVSDQFLVKTKFLLHPSSLERSLIAFVKAPEIKKVVQNSKINAILNLFNFYYFLL